MINIEMARDYFYRSKRCLREALASFGDGDYAGTIRRSQEALEMAIKSLLRALAIEYPRSHDVSDVLIENIHRLPEELKVNINDIARLITELSTIRGPSFYGYEREGIPASKAFTYSYAEEVLRKVSGYCQTIGRVLEQYKILQDG